MNLFLHGAITVCFTAVGLFFLRFWRDTLDRLFLLFALAFFLQALTRIGLSLLGGPEEGLYLYLFRLIAYALIIAAIAMKNVEASKGRGTGP
jgi:hypothetical protein